MANETTAVKDPIRKLLKQRGVEHMSLTTGGFGSSGWPDICFLYKGIFVGIECKYGKNKPTKLQEKRLDYIKAQGGMALLANEDSIRGVDDLLRLIEGTDSPLIEYKHPVERIEDIVACCKSLKIKLWRDEA